MGIDKSCILTRPPGGPGALSDCSDHVDLQATLHFINRDQPFCECCGVYTRRALADKDLAYTHTTLSFTWRDSQMMQALSYKILISTILYANKKNQTPSDWLGRCRQDCLFHKENWRLISKKNIFQQ